MATGSLDVRPTLSSLHVRDGGLRNAVTCCQSSLQLRRRSNDVNVRFCKLRSVVCFAPAMRHRRAAPALDAVAHVVDLRPVGEVIVAGARGVVALVPNDDAFGNRAVLENPRDAVCVLLAEGKELRIPKARFDLREPHPASAFDYLDVRKETAADRATEDTVGLWLEGCVALATGSHRRVMPQKARYS